MVCARPHVNEVGEPIVGSTTFHNVMIYTSAACLALNFLSTSYLTYSHIRHYRVPNEQRQILRIALMPFFYSLCNFVALCSYQNYQYIEPVASVYEAFATAALLLLVLEYCFPGAGETERKKFFEGRPFLDKKGKELESSSLGWYRRTYAKALQFPLSQLVVVIIQIITQYYERYCESAWGVDHAHLWLFLFSLLVIGGALEATIVFARRMNREMQIGHRSQAKIWCFVGIIIFQYIQQIIFNGLRAKLFDPTATVTFNDVNYGIPSFMTCIEAVVFSLMFLWAYSASEYKSRDTSCETANTNANALGIRNAILDAADPRDMLRGIAKAFTIISRGLWTWWNSSTQEKSGDDGKESIDSRSTGERSNSTRSMSDSSADASCRR